MLIVFTITLQGQNKLLSSIDESFDGTTWQIFGGTNYEYNSNNNLITETRYSYDISNVSWGISGKSTYVYNASNQLTNLIDQNWNSTTNQFNNSYREANTYTSGKYVGGIGENWNGAIWVNEWRNVLTYNSNNLPESALFYKWNGSQWYLESRESLTYNVNNKISEDLSEIWDGLGYVNSNKSLLTYNANNKITTYSFYEWDDFNSMWNFGDRTDYVLDATGNRISETYSSTNYKYKQEYTYDTSSLMSSFANPFNDKTGLDYIFEDFPFVYKLLVENNFDYDSATSAYKNTSRTTYDYTNSITLGTEKLEIVNAIITVFPNPATSLVNLNISNAVTVDKVVVIDITGKTVLQQNQNTTQVNVEKLAAGLYIIEANYGNEKFQTKFVKQ